MAPATLAVDPEARDEGLAGRSTTVLALVTLAAGAEPAGRTTVGDSSMSKEGIEGSTAFIISFVLLSYNIIKKNIF